LVAVAKRHGVTPAQVALAWGLRYPNVISIPKASDPVHVRENAAAIDVVLDARDLAEIDAAHPPPGRKQALDLL
jgi:diketogulonate reductase-like aldo/keto reductase